MLQVLEPTALLSLLVNYFVIELWEPSAETHCIIVFNLLASYEVPWYPLSVFPEHAGEKFPEALYDFEKLSFSQFWMLLHQISNYHNQNSLYL